MKRTTWHLLAIFCGCLGIYLLLINLIDGSLVQKRFFPFLPYRLVYAWVLVIIILGAETIFGRHQYLRYFAFFYGAFLIAILFVRPRISSRNLPIRPIFGNGKQIFSHPIIFVNIIGNIILFVPLGIIAKRILATGLNICTVSFC